PKVPVPVPWRREVPADERLPVATPLRGAAGAPGSRAIVWTPDAITPTEVPGLPAQPRVIPSNREIRGEGADVAAGALSAPGLLFALWAAGALAMALALATGLWSAASLRRGARRVSEPETIAAHERARATAAV